MVVLNSADNIMLGAQQVDVVYLGPDLVWQRAPAVYRNAVLADTPVVYWRLDETSGTTATDRSGNNNHGTYVNSPYLGQASLIASEPTNASVSFARASNHHVIRNSGLTQIPTGNAARSFECWLVPTDTGGGVLVSIGNATNASGQSFTLQMANTGGTYYLFTDGVNGSNNITQSFTRLPKFNVASHFVFTYDGSVWRYYLNGVFVASGTFGTAINTSVAAIAAGSRVDYLTGGNASPFHGRIDEVAIYNKTLTAADISDHYHAAVPRSAYEELIRASGPKLYYPLDDVDRVQWPSRAREESGNNWLGSNFNSVGGMVGPLPSGESAGAFNGASSFVTVPATTLADTPAGLTIEAWIYKYGDHQGFIWEKTTNGSVNTQYSLFLEGDGRVIFRTGGLADDLILSAGQIFNNMWTHIAATWDGSTKRVFLNGEQVASKTWAPDAHGQNLWSDTLDVMPTLTAVGDGGGGSHEITTVSPSQGSGSLRNTSQAGGHRKRWGSFVATSTEVVMAAAARSNGLVNSWNGGGAQTSNQDVVLELYDTVTGSVLTGPAWSVGALTTTGSLSAWSRRKATIAGLVVGRTYNISYYLGAWGGRILTDLDYVQIYATAGFPNGTAIIGAYGSGTAYFFNGAISHVAVYDRALPAAELQQRVALAAPATTYEDEVLADEPNAYWKLDGNGNDSSGKNHPLTIGTSATPVTTSPLGRGYSFGSGTASTTPDHADFDLTVYSYEFWIKPTNPNGNWRSIIVKGDGGMAGRAPGVWWPPNDLQLHFMHQAAGGPSGQTGLDTSQVVATAGWNHVVLTQDGSEARAYFNGSLVSVEANDFGSVLGTNSGPISIGASPVGEISDIAIYPTVLSPTRIRAHHAAGSQSYTAQVAKDKPRAYYRFEEITTTVAYDNNGWWGSSTGSIAQARHGGLDDGSSGIYYGGGNTNIPPAVLPITNTLSIEFLARKEAQANSNSILEGWDSSGRVINIHLGWGDGNIYWDCGGSAGTYDRIYKNADFDMTQWHHYVFTKNATSGRMCIYVDGVLWHSGTGTTRTFMGATALRIGSYADGTVPFIGSVDEFAIYDYELSGPRIATHAAAWRSLPVTSGLVTRLDHSLMTNPMGEAVTSAPGLNSQLPWTAQNGGPILRRYGQNGRAYLEQHASGTGLRNAENTNLYTSTIIVVASQRVTGSNAHNRIFAGLTNNYLLGWHGGQEDVAYFMGWVYGPNVPSGTSGHHTAVTTTSNVRTYTGQYRGGGNVHIWRNGVKVAENTGLGGDTANGMSTNGHMGANEFSDSNMYEVLVWNRILTDTELAQVHMYLGEKYGTFYDTNIALGRQVKAKGGTLDAARPLSWLTDGVHTSTNQYTSSLDGANGWMQVDLEKIYKINRVKVWHYYPDTRTYYSPRTEVSVDGVNWTAVATPAQYAETSEGNLRTFAPVYARYVRDYISGSTSNAGNHWFELQVFPSP